MISKELMDLEKEVIEKYLKALIEKKDDVSLILTAHLYVEHWIELFVRHSLPKPEKILDSANLRFSEKLALAESLGFDRNDECGLAKAIKKLNVIRNKIVHNLEYKISKEDLKLLSILKFELGENEKKAVKNG